MYHIAKQDTLFYLYNCFCRQTAEKIQEISKITDILAVADTILIYRKNRYLKRQYRYDTDNIDIGDISALLRYIDPALTFTS